MRGQRHSRVFKVSFLVLMLTCSFLILNVILKLFAIAGNIETTEMFMLGDAIDIERTTISINNCLSTKECILCSYALHHLLLRAYLYILVLLVLVMVLVIIISSLYKKLVEKH